MNFEDYKNRLNALLIQMQDREGEEDSPEFLDLLGVVRELRNALSSLHTKSLEDLKHYFKRLEDSGRQFQRSGLQVRGTDGEIININDSLAELCAENVINPLKEDIYRIVETAIRNPEGKYAGGDMEFYKKSGRLRLSSQDEVTPVQKFKEKSAGNITARLLWIGEFMAQKGRDCSARGTSLRQELQDYDQDPFREFWNAVTYLSTHADPEKKAQVAVMLANRERQLLNEIRKTRTELYQSNLIEEYRNNHPNATAEEIRDAVDRQLVTRKCFRDMRSYEHLKNLLIGGIGQQRGALASELRIATERIVNPKRYEDAADPAYSYKTDVIVQRLQRTQEGRTALNAALSEDRKEIRTSGIPEAIAQGAEEGPVRKCSNFLKQMDITPEKDGRAWLTLANTLYKLKNQDFSDYSSRELENAVLACRRAAQEYINSHNHTFTSKGKRRKALAARIQNEVEAYFTPRIAEARRQRLRQDFENPQVPQNQNRNPADLARVARGQQAVNPNPVRNGENRNAVLNVENPEANRANADREATNQQAGGVLNHVQAARQAVGQRIGGQHVLDLDAVKLPNENKEEKTNPVVIDLDEKEPENREEAEKKDGKPESSGPVKEKIQEQMRRETESLEKWLQNRQVEVSAPEKEEEEDEKEEKKAGSKNKIDLINLQQLKDDEELKAHAGAKEEPKVNPDLSYRDEAGIVEDLLRVKKLLQGNLGETNRFQTLNNDSALESIKSLKYRPEAENVNNARKELIGGIDTLLMQFDGQRDRLLSTDLSTSFNKIQGYYNGMRNSVESWSRFKLDPSTALLMDLSQMKSIADAAGAHLELINGKIRKQLLEKVEVKDENSRIVKENREKTDEEIRDLVQAYYDKYLAEITKDTDKYQTKDKPIDAILDDFNNRFDREYRLARIGLEEDKEREDKNFNYYYEKQVRIQSDLDTLKDDGIEKSKAGVKTYSKKVEEINNQISKLTEERRERQEIAEKRGINWKTAEAVYKGKVWEQQHPGLLGYFGNQDDRKNKLQKLEANLVSIAGEEKQIRNEKEYAENQEYLQKIPKEEKENWLSEEFLQLQLDKRLNDNNVIKSQSLQIDELLKEFQTQKEFLQSEKDTLVKLTHAKQNRDFMANQVKEAAENIKKSKEKLGNLEEKERLFEEAEKDRKILQEQLDNKLTERGDLSLSLKDAEKNFDSVRKALDEKKPEMLTSMEKETVTNIRSDVRKNLRTYCTDVISSKNRLFSNEKTFNRLSEKVQQIPGLQGSEGSIDDDYMSGTKFGTDYYTLVELCQQCLNEVGQKEVQKRAAVKALKNYLDGLADDQMKEVLNIPKERPVVRAEEPVKETAEIEWDLSAVGKIMEVVDQINNGKIQETPELMEAIRKSLNNIDNEMTKRGYYYKLTEDEDEDGFREYSIKTRMKEREKVTHENLAGMTEKAGSGKDSGELNQERVEKKKGK